MREPGMDRHEWETEWQALEPLEQFERELEAEAGTRPTATSPGTPSRQSGEERP